MKLNLTLNLDEVSWPALLVDAAGVVRRANPAAATLFGLPPEGGASFAQDLWAPDNPGTALAYLQKLSGPTPPQPLRLRTPQGASVAFQATVANLIREGAKLWLLQLCPVGPPGAKAGTPGAAAGGGTAAEEAAHQRQKLDCALQLTRTVALDFNNALTSILGHASLVLGKMPADHPWRGSLVEIEKSAEKAAEIAQDLAAFSRQEKEPSARATGDLNDLVRRTVEVVKVSAKADVRWHLALEEQVYTVTFDEAKMQQAFVKILENALQALGGGGRIDVRTRNVDRTEPESDGGVPLPAGSQVCIEFVDSGEGIAPEVLPRVFEPFFTTRKDARHRGLGLAWVYGIVTNHGGSVAVSSQVGQGTSVRIYLPARRQFVRGRALKTDDLTGTQTILMVDDEDLVLTMGRMILTSFGYRVLTANSGPKALELFTPAPDAVDLVITDLVMPNMSGRELLERLRAVRPELRVICSSGYARASGQEDVHYLKKPFTSQDLLRKVKQALE
ncbi:MAG: response regulator [Verrucomicrobia bacterium]|nr:response regulator [Verrucomicrobiota bacterium]